MEIFMEFVNKIVLPQYHFGYHDLRFKSTIKSEIKQLKLSGRMLGPAEAENQMSSISTFHPVGRIQGQNSTLLPEINITWSHSSNNSPSSIQG
jgi:hypothetical protein